MNAKLILENGLEFSGTVFGAIQEVSGEVVFNTSMTGYQEILTDPSYYGQMVTFTYPLIGNYGLNLDDHESDGVKVRAMIVREKAKYPNNFRYEFELDNYLKKQNIVGIEGIDTRALTKVLRNEGTMRGMISLYDKTEDELNLWFDKVDLTDAVKQVTTKAIAHYGSGDTHVVFIDCGTKKHIVENLSIRNVLVTVVPATSSVAEIEALKPDGIFISNGPGDPKDASYVVETIKGFIGKIPICGICLGHQIIGLALGADTKRLTFGHRGGNHPVKDLRSNKVTITAQNHGYIVDKDTLPKHISVTHISLNDSSLEGMEDKVNQLFSVQYHPEACPGPEDSELLFDEFVDVIRGGKNEK